MEKRGKEGRLPRALCDFTAVVAGYSPSPAAINRFRFSDFGFQPLGRTILMGRPKDLAATVAAPFVPMPMYHIRSTSLQEGK